jgi:hypothetical protein
MTETMRELADQMGKVNALLKACPSVLSAYADPYNLPQIHINETVFRTAFRGCVVTAEKAGRYEHLSYPCCGVRFTACREIVPISTEVML